MLNKYDIIFSLFILFDKQQHTTMAKYDPNNITETLRLDQGMRHLCVDFRQQASLILYRRPDKTTDDKTLVSEFGAKLFVLVCVWRLLCDYGGLTEEESDPKYLLWWLYLVRNYPRQKTFEGQITLNHQQTIRKNMQPIKEAMLKIKPYVVSNNMSVVLRNNKC